MAALTSMGNAASSSGGAPKPASSDTTAITGAPRPHNARADRTPKDAFDALDKARPGDPVAGTHFRVRTVKVDSCGKMTLRHDSKLFPIAI